MSLLAKIRTTFCQPVWALEYREGQTHIIKGKLRSGFISEVKTLLQDHQCKNAWIHGDNSANGIRLRFSKSIPKELHQKLRNIWSFSGI